MKVKRIIEIDEEIIAEMEKFPHRAIKIIKNRDCLVADAILNSKPYVEPACPYLSDQEVKQPCIDSPCVRPRGEWEDVICEKGGFYHATCSNCKIRNDIPPVDFAHFCPNCGADMRGGSENE